MLHTNLRTEQDLSLRSSPKPSQRTNPNKNIRSSQARTPRPTLIKTGFPYLFSRVDSKSLCTYQYRRRLLDSSIQRSLLTDDFATAILRTQELNRATEIVLDKVRETMARTTVRNEKEFTGMSESIKKKSQSNDLPYHVIKKALNETYDRVLSKYKIRMNEEGPYSPEGLHELQKTFDSAAEWNAVLNSLPGDQPTPAEVLANMAGLTNITEKDLSLVASQRPGMLKALSYAINEYNYAVQEFGDNAHNLFENQSLESVPEQNHSKSSQRITIQDLIDDFTIDKESGKAWTPKSAGEIASILACMKDILHALGVQSPSDLSSDIVIAFKKVLTALPKNPIERKIYLKDLEGSSGDQIKNRTREALENGACISTTTVNKYLIRVSALMDFATNHSYIDRNFFNKLTIKQKKRKSDARKAYTPAQIQVIIKTILEKSNLKGANLKPFHRWLPLLGIFTGARLNELCQIYLGDISEREGIPCISITDKRPDQRLKNLSSERVIPIHPELINLGFLNFVHELRGKKESRLFPELILGRDGYSKNASRWFASFRKEVLSTGDGLVFHSFRHTAATQMKRKGVGEGYAAAILGHSHDSMTYGHYGKGYTAQQLLGALEDGLVDLYSAILCKSCPAGLCKV